MSIEFVGGIERLGDKLGGMLLIPCPWCGPRDDIEFHYGGEAHIARPAEPDAADDAAWGEYLYLRTNPKRIIAERWMHKHGCRQWFNLLRDTVSHQIIAAYRMGEFPPGYEAAP